MMMSITSLEWIFFFRKRFSKSMKSIKLFEEDNLLPRIVVFEDMIETYPNFEVLAVNELYPNETHIKMKDKVSEACEKPCSSPSCEEKFHVPIILIPSPYAVPLIVEKILQSPKIETNCEPELTFLDS